MLAKRMPEMEERQSIKRRRCCLTIEDKIKLLDHLKSGQRVCDIRSKFGISESAIRSIQQREKKLRQYAINCPNNAHKSISYMPRNSTLEQAEQLVFQWYEEQRSLGRTLTIASICDHAREVYAELKKVNDLKRKVNCDDTDLSEDEYERDFKGSKGWFNNFRKRYSLNFKSTYEIEPLDHQAARQYCQHFQHKVCGKYEPQQVFSAAQFSLPWRNIPESRNIAQRDRGTLRQECISLLLCGNASGDYHVKPMLVYRTLNPFCMRSRDPNELPVFWRSRPRDSQSTPKVTATLFHDWFTECFVPSIRDYLQIMELPQRCLLLLNADMLVTQLPDDNEFVQFEFLPENTGPLLHPITLSTVPIFKCKYFQNFLSFFLQRLNEEPAQSLFKLWRNFTISNSIDLIQEALEEMTADCWNNGWTAIWKEIAKKPLSSSTLNDEIQRIADIGSNLLADGLTIDQIRNHLKLDNEAEVTEQGTDDESEENDAIDMEERQTKIEASSIFDVTNSRQDHVSIASNDEDNQTNDDNESLLRDFESVNSIDQKQISDATKLRAKKQNTEDKNTKVQRLKNAITLSEQLIEVIGEINAKNEEYSKFKNDLNALMKPYKEMKDKLLQPSILNYFKRVN